MIPALRYTLACFFALLSSFALGISLIVSNGRFDLAGVVGWLIVGVSIGLLTGYTHGRVRGAVIGALISALVTLALLPLIFKAIDCISI